MKKVFLIFTLLSFFIPSVSFGEPIPEDVKQVVGFIQIIDIKTKQTRLNGTGFLIGITEETAPNKMFGYFITAKHVLKNKSSGTFYKAIAIHLNKNDGSRGILPIPLLESGDKKNVYCHADPGVDLAVIPLYPDSEKFQFKVITEKFFIKTKEEFENYGIGEGSDIFFTGLFTQYHGYEKNYPIVRFGRVALMTEEKISWGGEKIDLYLIECSVYGGNSGSPVFFHFSNVLFRNQAIRAGGTSIKLAGVIKGNYQNISPVKEIEVDTRQFSLSNVGIAGVIPSYKLHEILYGDELINKRKMQIEEFIKKGIVPKPEISEVE